MRFRGSLRHVQQASFGAFFSIPSGWLSEISPKGIALYTAGSQCLPSTGARTQVPDSCQHDGLSSHHESSPLSLSGPSSELTGYSLKWKAARFVGTSHHSISNRAFTSATSQPSVGADAARGGSSSDERSSDADESDTEAVAPGRASPDGTSPRFYKRAGAALAAEGGGWVVKLDHRVLKTPAKKPVQVPTEALALAIAAEWEWQEGRHLRPYTMPMMKLAATAIDQIPRDRERVIHVLLKYFHTDSVCLRAPPSLLADKQSEVWDPLLRWVEGEIGARPTTSSELLAPDQPQATVDAMEKVLRAADDWQLAVIDSLAGTARSLVIGLAVARQRLGISEAMEAIRLEEDFQVEEWGFVEGGHDVDIADLRIRIAAPSVFLRMLEMK